MISEGVPHNTEGIFFLIIVFITFQVIYSEDEIYSEDNNFSEFDGPIVENGVHILNQENFNKEISKGDFFIKFYDPGCYHCKKLAPVWSKLAETFKDDKKVKIAKLDCTQAQSICDDWALGYPTLIYSRNGKFFDKYYEDRDLDTLIDFVKSRRDGKFEGELPPPPKETIIPVESIILSSVFCHLLFSYLKSKFGK